MVVNDDSVARIKLANRILIQTRCGGGQPLLQSEIAQLRFLAEGEEESVMPLDKLAQKIIEREARRMGMPTPPDRRWFTGRN
jgi:hypothetical protein